MADLIDRDALMADLATSVVFSGRTSRNAGMRGANKIIDRIKAAPTVDAVEVVRCRDCNHCDPENYHCDHYMGTVAPLRRKPDDFCSYGERKDGDGNG